MQHSSRVFFIRVFKGVLSSEFKEKSELVDQEQKNANGNQQKTRLEASKPPTYFTTAFILHKCAHIFFRPDMKRRR